MLLNLLLKVWFALEAGRQLAEDRRQGALELLLSTPLTVQDILRGQLLALKRQFLGPVVVTLLVFFLFMMAAASDEMLLENPEDRSFWVLSWAAGMVMLVADLAALYWVGMWKALTAKNPTRAAASNLGRILVLPWVVLALGALVISLRLAERRTMSRCRSSSSVHGSGWAWRWTSVLAPGRVQVAHRVPPRRDAEI